MRFFYLFRSGLFSLSLLILAGCASLPGVHDLIYGPLDFRYPLVTDARGVLSPAQSRRIIDRLEKQSGSTDLLTRQSIILEEITGSPLIAGNKAKLLIDGPATFAAMKKAILKESMLKIVEN